GGGGGVQAHPRAQTRTGGTEPARHPPPAAVLASAGRDGAVRPPWIPRNRPRSTRRCFDRVGCGMRSRRSISPTDRWDETRRLRIARRFGSAMIAKADSTLLIYSTEHMRVKAYTAHGGA